MKGHIILSLSLVDVEAEEFRHKAFDGERLEIGFRVTDEKDHDLAPATARQLGTKCAMMDVDHAVNVSLIVTEPHNAPGPVAPRVPIFRSSETGNPHERFLAVYLVDRNCVRPGNDDRCGLGSRTAACV
jgi:hypothetical protein